MASARRRRLAVTLGLVALVTGGVFGFVSLTDRGEPEATPTPTPTPTAPTGPIEIACGGAVPPARDDIPEQTEPPPMTIDAAKTYTATIETSCGDITVELAGDTSPQTVNSFVFLARQGFFDGLTFHRVVAGFAIQGGDPNGDGTGGPGYKVTEAPPADTTYLRGIVAMAKGAAEPAGTSGSQFFIVPGEDAGLPPEYAVLGRVTEGLEVLERIEQVPTAEQSSGEKSLPLQTIYIVRITIVES